MSVPTRYYGGMPISNLYYSSQEEFDAIKNGELFKTENFNWYCRAVEFDVKGSAPIPTDMVCIEKTCSTSKCTKRWSFYKLEKMSGQKIYYAGGLKRKIYSEISSWMRNVNPKTGRAFSGKSFLSYIKALPREFLLDEKFYEKVQDLIAKGAIERIKGAQLEEINFITEFKKQADLQLAQAKNPAFEENKGLKELSAQSSKALSDARAKAIAEISGKN